MTAYDLLAGHYQVNGLQPQVKIDVALFEDRAHAGCELLAAVATRPEAIALLASWAFAGRLCADTLEAISAANAAAIWRHQAFRPQHGLHVRRHNGFIVRVDGGKTDMAATSIRKNA